MADRNTKIPGNQILDDSVKQDELDITNVPTDGQILKVNMPTGDFTAIDLPGASTPDSIEDADGDTKVQTEESADEDIIRFDAGGTQEAQIDSNGLTLKSGASVNEFSTDGTLAGNSDDAVPTEKAVKTYVDNNAGGDGLSNVLYCWNGYIDYLGGVHGEIQTTSLTDTTTNAQYRYIRILATGYQTVLTSKFKKISSISTVTVYGKIWQNSSASAELQVNIGGQTNSVTGTAGKTSPEWKNFTIDVSSLSDGTVYDITIQLRANSPGRSGNLGAIILFGS